MVRFHVLGLPVPEGGEGNCTLLEYFLLMLSSMASALGLVKSSGAIWTRSEMVVCLEVSVRLRLGKRYRSGHTRMNILLALWSHLLRMMLVWKSL